MPSGSRSPSPAPPPPTTASPGPRATALQKLYSDAITHILKTCSYPNFASCFPTPAAQVPTALRAFHEVFTSRLDASLRKEFLAILEERDVIPALNELDRLIDDAKRRKAKAGAEDTASPPVPPHTLPAKQLYISHFAPALGRYREEMQARQDALAAENQELFGKVMQQRKDIKSLIDGLENVVNDLNGSVEALQPDEMEGLRQGNRETDETMR